MRNFGTFLHTDPTKLKISYIILWTKSKLKQNLGHELCQILKFRFFQNFALKIVGQHQNLTLQNHDSDIEFWILVPKFNIFSQIQNQFFSSRPNFLSGPKHLNSAMSISPQKKNSRRNSKFSSTNILWQYLDFVLEPAHAGGALATRALAYADTKADGMKKFITTVEEKIDKYFG